MTALLWISHRDLNLRRTVRDPLPIHDLAPILSAVIDFGTSGTGAPACDLVIAWTMLREESREAFRHTVGQDDGTWARARGWALWKFLLTLTQCSDPRDGRVAIHLDVIDTVLADHERFA
ncbi:phosphotransferase [Streptomyces sp. Ncost-T10-10d]|uniref:phosphotransferase n=1 Tax=Streptomyces sp. Ncost-T10-10d TaxID=1839774 RepID=UPI00081D7F7F|nr:phosphotransferase [Streptomyces sp. Ncost-T10-10d]SCF61747.1 Phosphotransferase enzyme family protein [Streptomyces sp. Ncost-T10-10d]